MMIKKAVVGGCLSAVLLVSFMKMPILAEGTAMDIMPAGESAVSADTSVTGSGYAGSFTYESGVLTLVATGSSGYRVVYTVGKDIDYETLRSLYISVSCDANFNIAFIDDSASSIWHGLASDWYPSFGEGSSTALIVPGNYQDVELNFYDAVTYNPEQIPSDGLFNIKQMVIAVKAPGTLTLSRFEAAAATESSETEAAGDVTTTAADATTTAATDTTTTATITTAATTATTVTKATTTTAATTEASAANAADDDEGSGALIWGIVIGVVVVAGAGVGYYFIRKKKAEGSNS